METVVKNKINKTIKNKLSEINTKKIPNLLKNPTNGGNPAIDKKTNNKLKATNLFVLFSTVKSVIFFENLLVLSLFLIRFKTVNHIIIFDNK
jgi:hypothetical protein